MLCCATQCLEDTFLGMQNVKVVRTVIVKGLAKRKTVLLCYSMCEEGKGLMEVENVLLACKCLKECLCFVLMRYEMLDHLMRWVFRRSNQVVLLCLCSHAIYLFQVKCFSRPMSFYYELIFHQLLKLFLYYYFYYY